MGGFGLASRVLCLGARKKEVRPPPPADPHSRKVATAARTFAFDELAMATRNFRDDFLIVGREASLYKAYLKSVKQVVAIKHAVESIGSPEQLNREFLARVKTLSALRHPNVASLVGFCTDGHHRILVHEHMLLGSLEDHLHDRSPGKAPLDWNTRMNIAAAVAKGLEYLHGKGVTTGINLYGLLPSAYPYADGYRRHIPVDVDLDGVVLSDRRHRSAVGIHGYADGIRTAVGIETPSAKKSAGQALTAP